MEAEEKTVAGFSQAELRSPDHVMKLARMGCFYPTRLSFMRTTIRQLAKEAATVTRPVWEMDDQGYGRAVYSVSLGGYTYSLIAYSNAIPAEMRTDRVIAEVWDTTYVLFDGVPTTADLDRLQENAPKQEAGRYLPTELVLSRANKSVRLFEHVVDALASGEQPDQGRIAETGYLMRTTAVYGNGKFGIADRARIRNRPGMDGPFQAEMLSVWLTRTFTHDLADHVAACRNPDKAVRLDRRLKRNLGIGNSTGLGMAPYLVSHPILLNNWMMVRETALARVRALESFDEETIERYRQLADRAASHLDQWQVEDERQMGRILTLRREWQDMTDFMATGILGQSNPADRMIEKAAGCSLEAQELVVALLLEPHGDLVDGLADCMASDVEPQLDPAMPVGQLRQSLEDSYRWALDLDLSTRQARCQFWYVSEEKLEPRLGNRFEEEGAELELPHDIALRVQKLDADLADQPEALVTAEFLMRHPEHRYMVRRVQTTARFPYAEIRDNLVGDICLPIDMLRCKLSFFGASKFDPKSDRWTRITLYQGAPLADEINAGAGDVDDWWLPVLEVL